MTCPDKVHDFADDRSFPHVLVCSTLGTIVSLASVWIITAFSLAPVLGS